MIEWFLQNFEDPAESTPYESAEGGYQWIWGGPFEARDELYSKFGDIAPERLIEEVAEEVEREGITDWAPVRKDEDWEDIDWSERFDEPPPLDLYLDQQSPRYGTPEELEARAKARTALDRLEKALEWPAPGSEDTELGVFMEPEVSHGETKVYAGVQA